MEKNGLRLQTMVTSRKIAFDIGLALADL